MVMRTVTAVALLIVLGACAVAPTPPRGPVADAPAGVPQWWIVRVRMGGEDPSRVRWHLDALLADRVFGPIIDRHAPALVLWRFHRRAAPDESGHQFRFLFFADAAIAGQIFRALHASAVLHALESRGYLRAVLIPSPGAGSGTRIEAHSDPAWPDTVQRAWPHFAMGVSRNWLVMIRAEAEQVPQPPAPGDVDALVAHYEIINRAVDGLWQRHAQHAWLHHLNALFGYQPVLIHEQRLMRF